MWGHLNFRFTEKLIGVASVFVLCLMSESAEAQPMHVVDVHDTGVSASAQFQATDAQMFCPTHHAGRGWISAWPATFFFDFHAILGDGMASPRVHCATDLGQYENGVRIGSNNGRLEGRYVKTDILSYKDINPDSSVSDIDSIHSNNNDFRVQLVYDDIGTDLRESALHLSETNAYYHITRYMNLYFRHAMNQIGLSQEVYDRVVNKGYRDDLPGFNPEAVGTPLHLVSEDTPVGAFQLLPTENLQIAPSLVRYHPQLGIRPPISYSYDGAMTAGEYVGLRAFALTETNKGFPGEFGFGLNWTSMADMSPVLNDALNLWVAHEYTRETEVARNLWSSVRHWVQWSNFFSSIPCNEIGKPECSRGLNLDSALMYHPNISDRDGIFPPRQPDTYEFGMGAIEADLAALFVANILYEISRFVGVRETSRLYYKFLSMFGDQHFNDMNMVEFGQLLLQAAEALDIHRGELSSNQEIISRVLVRKGVPTDPSNLDIESYLPERIGEFPISLERNSSNRFGSSFPESHPTVDNSVSGPGSINYFSNGYIANVFPHGGFSVQLWDGSRYGPCDYLAVTDGTFTDEVYNNDGSFYRELKGRSLENLVLLVPGDKIRWLRYREKCQDFNQGDYTNDFRPAGFRAVKATTAGYSFKVSRVRQTGSTVTYQFEVVDPYADSVPGFQEVSYEWDISVPYGQEVQVTEVVPGLSTKVEVVLPKNEGVNIQLNRTLLMEEMLMIVEVDDQLEIFEPTNLLDRLAGERPKGEAFFIDLSQSP